MYASGKIDSSEDIFHISFNHSLRNAKKSQREKSWQDESLNLSKKILTATETMTQKFPTYLLGMSNHIFKFIFKTAQYPFVASLCWYVYFNFFKKKHDCARFSFKKFQEMDTKSLFLSSNIAFQLVSFQYLKNHLTKIVHWPHYVTIIESSKCWEN